MASSAPSDKAPHAEKKPCPEQTGAVKDTGFDFPIPVPEKSSWPELVGATGEAAKEAIEKDNHKLDVIIMPPGAIWTFDWRSNRVRVKVDSNGIVIETPRIG